MKSPFEIKKEICEVGHKLWLKGFVAANDGNISVKISDNEVEFLWDCTPEEGADKLLREFGVSLAMVTLGPDGCLLKTKNAAFCTPCPKVHPVDTTGAGDIFGGSALARLLELEKPICELTQEDLAYIGRFAATAASLSTQTVGGIPSIPEKSDVLKAM